MNTYKPIACSYYDYLLELATFKRITSIIYKENNIKLELKAVIVDVYTKSGIEFLKTNTDHIIQLDHLLSVNNKLNTNENCNVK